MKVSAKPLSVLIGETLQQSEQAALLKLPRQLVLAFRMEEHKRTINPNTGKPFATFYQWLWATPPGVGMCGRGYLGINFVLDVVGESLATTTDPETRDLLEGILTDLTAGRAACKSKGGGDQRSAKANDHRNGTIAVIPPRKANVSKYSLSARMAESKNPDIQREWKRYLMGEHRTVNRAAIAAGLVTDRNAPLIRLKQNWLKASKADKRAFVKFMEENQ